MNGIIAGPYEDNLTDSNVWFRHLAEFDRYIVYIFIVFALFVVIGIVLEKWNTHRRLVAADAAAAEVDEEE